VIISLPNSIELIESPDAKKALFNSQDLCFLLLLLAAAAILYYPVFYAEYLYTDEATQVWLSGKGINLTSVPQGRYLTYRLFTWLFASIHTTHAVIYARLFSLAGWIICLPIWYGIVKKSMLKNGFGAAPAMLTLVYLISMPSFAISIGWAACLEMFIASTSGLLAGHFIYAHIKYDDVRLQIGTAPIVLSIVAGIVSLFTYQNGFGCFFIPFFIHFVATKKISREIIAGIVMALLIYICYFLLFKYNLRIYKMPPDARSAFAVNPLKKIFFLFTRPLAAAFHFTWLFKDKSMAGEIIYAVIFACWLLVNVIRLKAKPIREMFSYFAGLVVFFILIYLPSLIVSENYASNRTLMALNLAVCIMMAETIFHFLKDKSWRYLATGIAAAFFLANGWYNFHLQFINPLATEYSAIKKIVLGNYTSKTSTVYFIRPAENAFEKKYGIVASWDEFGIPSSAKKWVPEPLVKQLIFEKTGNRQTADTIVVKSYPENEVFINTADTTGKNTMVINFAKILMTD